MVNKPKVYFSKTVSPQRVLEMYQALGKPLEGKVLAKVHSGEEGNQNYLRPEFWAPVIRHLNATVGECNTAYDGERNSTEKHRKLLAGHGWTGLFNVDLMDAEGPDLTLPIHGGKILKENKVGKNLAGYDSMVVLSHFKGHPMGGYGGALKQLSIGCASTAGKCLIHSAGVTDDQRVVWDRCAPQDDFCKAMAEAASSVVDFFHGNIVYLNIMCNLSVDCDCCAVAEDPCMADIGVLASLDPVAIDQACLDLVYASDDPGKAHFIERVESRHGVHTVEHAAALGFGKRDYELVSLDG